MNGLAIPRFTLVEYGEPVPLVQAISSRMGMQGHAVRSLLEAASNRVAGALGYERGPIQLLGNEVRAVDFAGIIALSPNIELEIAPKFSGAVEGWQDDFFLIALLTRHGQILEEGLAASASARTDLPTLIGRALVTLYWRQRRRPIRTYRRVALRGFEIDGDFDPVDLLFPEDDGYPQIVTSLTRVNGFNGVLRRAAATLALAAQDAQTRLGLERVVHDLPPSGAYFRLTERPLPSRSRAWKPTYLLGLDVLRGLSGSFSPGGSEAPGFVVDTWRAWEALLSVAIRSHFGHRLTQTQKKTRLGTARAPWGTPRLVTVTPDLTVSVAGGHGTGFLVDAKYKGHAQRGRSSVQSADVHESLAFSKATGLEVVCLVYPRVPDGSGSVPVGTVRLIERIDVDAVRILALDVSVPGLSAPGGLKRFSQSLGTSVMSIIEDANVPGS